MRKALDNVTALLGFLSLIALVFYFLALHDIFQDYASPHVWAHAGKPLPDWYDPVNRCWAEWKVLQIGFLPLLGFHVMFFVRAVAHAKGYFGR